MEHLLKQVDVALSYHVKDTINKHDILHGDEMLLKLITDNLSKQFEYEILHTRVRSILDEKLSGCSSEDSQYQQVSSEDEELQINNAIIDVLNQIDNQFVREELIRVALVPKKMLRSKMFLKVQKSPNYQYAALIELFHLSTLIQDDVIDKANIRRHIQTINSKYDNRTAILLSDYLLVHIGYILGMIGQDNRQRVEKTTSEIQMFYKNLIIEFLNKLLYSERSAQEIDSNHAYNEYAKNKTARFFQVALISGLLANEDDDIETLEAIGKFGLDFGLLFQKVDDLLDYKDDVSISGKDARDIENGINNYILLNIDKDDVETIKAELNKEANNLLHSKYNETFNQEIKYLIRRINE
ncbi:polyprenyl synthetase family protein [Mollicutes bacterium LVI A0039]|nr:polyprenyl synthetase family protein [Mollicutes bacterium LVI A0039]